MYVDVCLLFLGSGTCLPGAMSSASEVNAAPPGPSQALNRAAVAVAGAFAALAYAVLLAVALRKPTPAPRCTARPTRFKTLLCFPCWMYRAAGRQC